MRRRSAWTAVATLLLLGLLASSAQATFFPADSDPGGYHYTRAHAIAVAERTSAVRKERARGPLERAALVSTSRLWLIQYKRGNGPVLVEVDIHDKTGEVEVWTGLHAAWPFSRPQSGAGIVRLQLVLLAAVLAFLLPFVDPRRPFRLFHLDLAVLASFGISHIFWIHGNTEWAMPLIYPPLLYLLVRMLWLSPARAKEPSEPLARWAPTWFLAAGLGVLVAGHVAYNLLSGLGVWDGGYDSVWGADTIAGGWPLYVHGAFPLNVYGPATYLAYVPFEALFPLGIGWQHDFLPAAHAATLTFDLLTVFGLCVLGRRLRPGAAGTRLGLALAWGWAAFPYTWLVLGTSTNDMLVPMLIVWTLVLARTAALRGVFLGLACAAKLYPLPLAAPFARGPGERWGRPQLVYGLSFAAVLVLTIAPYLPDPGGIHQFLELTAGSQLDRQSPFSLWGLHPSLGWLRDLLPFATAALAAALAFWPRERNLVTLAAAAGALVIAQELFLIHWFYLYISWFVAPVLIVVFAQMSTSVRAPYPARDS